MLIKSRQNSKIKQPGLHNQVAATDEADFDEPSDPPVWRGSLQHIQTWRPASGLESDQSKSQKKLDKMAKSVQNLKSISPPGSTQIMQISVLDREKMIDQCERDMFDIEREFALLQSRDFVEILQS